MGNKDIHENDWQAEAPVLSSLREEAQPEPPEGYFEGLNTIVMGRLRAQSSAPVIPLQRTSEPPAGGLILGFRRTVVLSLVASVTILMVLGLALLQPGTPEPLGSSDAAILEETLEQLQQVAPSILVADLHTSDINDEELFAMLDEEATASLGEVPNAVPNDEAEAYLDEVDLNNIDFDDLDINLEGL